MRRGRPKLRWEDCVKRDVRKTGEEEDRKKETSYRRGRQYYQMRRGRNCGRHLTPDKGKKRKRERERTNCFPLS